MTTDKQEAKVISFAATEDKAANEKIAQERMSLERDDFEELSKEVLQE